MRRRLVAVVAAAVLALLAAAVGLAELRDTDPAPRRTTTQPVPATPSATTSTVSDAPYRVRPGATLSARPRPTHAPLTCSTSPGLTGSFDPARITVLGVTTRTPVIAPPRDANGVPGVPPLSSTGKTEFAWDREQGIRPGDARGNVLLNAHTWPDGTALGNHLLGGLRPGGQLLVEGEGERLCYRVTERVEVPAAQGLPSYFASDGPPQLAIVVCSGRRLGPGNWEKRTIWFAAPSA